MIHIDFPKKDIEFEGDGNRYNRIWSIRDNQYYYYENNRMISYEYYCEMVKKTREHYEKDCKELWFPFAEKVLSQALEDLATTTERVKGVFFDEILADFQIFLKNQTT